jgi:hypothetical protein
VPRQTLAAHVCIYAAWLTLQNDEVCCSHIVLCVVWLNDEP